jgi:hypothetical protein
MALKEVGTTFIVSMSIIFVLILVSTGSANSIWSKYDVSKFTPPFADTALKQTVSKILIPSALMVFFLNVQTISNLLVAVPFMMSAKDTVEDIKTDKARATKTVSNIDSARESIVRVQIFILCASTLFALNSIFAFKSIRNAIEAGVKDVQSGSPQINAWISGLKKI